VMSGEWCEFASLPVTSSCWCRFLSPLLGISVMLVQCPFGLGHQIFLRIGRVGGGGGMRPA
jgi:hypothetical protein